MITFFLGKRSGVAAHLREENPEIVIIHCLAHRLELAFKDAIKQIGNRLYEKTTTLLLGWFKIKKSIIIFLLQNIH